MLINSFALVLAATGPAISGATAATGGSSSSAVVQDLLHRMTANAPGGGPITPQRRTQEGTVFDIVKDEPQFVTLEGLLFSAGLQDAVATTDPLTLLAPTDTAFFSTPFALLNYFSSNTTALTEVLLYHAISTADPLEDGATYTTLNGNAIAVTADGEDFRINGGAADTLGERMPATNGALYTLDAVLLPPGFTYPGGPPATTPVPTTAPAPTPDIVETPDGSTAPSSGPTEAPSSPPPVSAPPSAQGATAAPSPAPSSSPTSLAGVPGPSTPGPAPPGAFDLIENLPILLTFVNFIEQAGLQGTINNQDPLTLLAPRNSAFFALPEATRTYLASNSTAMNEVLTYHCLTTADTLADGESYGTLEGQSVVISEVDGQVVANGEAEIGQRTLTSNGAVYLSDKVLLPPGFPGIPGGGVTATPSSAATDMEMPSAGPTLSAAPSETPDTEGPSAGPTASAAPSETPDTEGPSAGPTASSAPSETVDSEGPSAGPTASAAPSETPDTERPSAGPTASAAPSESVETEGPSTGPTASAAPSETVETEGPSAGPTASSAPSTVATEGPSAGPTASAAPSENVETEGPSVSPSTSVAPSVAGGGLPLTAVPSASPTASNAPSESEPSPSPSMTAVPSFKLTAVPSAAPTITASPSTDRELETTAMPSVAAGNPGFPTIIIPDPNPTPISAPSASPTAGSGLPGPIPSSSPTALPTESPSVTANPSDEPMPAFPLTAVPSSPPSTSPAPSSKLTAVPSVSPSISQASISQAPSVRLTAVPSVSPSISGSPTESPTDAPSDTVSPSDVPTGAPTVTGVPTASAPPSGTPSVSMMPTISSAPSVATATPSSSDAPSETPTMGPTTSASPTSSMMPSVGPSVGSNLPPSGVLPPSGNQPTGPVPSSEPSVSAAPTMSQSPSMQPSISSSPTITATPSTTGIAPVSGSLVDLIVSSDELSTLETAIITAPQDVADTLSSGGSEGGLTMFTPDNDAFAAVDSSLLNLLLTEPYADHLKCFIYAHVVGGTVLAEDIEGESSAPTLASTEVKLSGSADGVTVDEIPVTDADVTANNGVAHVISEKPIIPPCVSDGLFDVIQSTPTFSTLERLLVLARKGDEVNTERPLTLLGPTDDAFSKLPEDVLNYLAGNIAALNDVLDYHTLPSLDKLEAGSDYTTAQGSDISVSSGTGESDLTINGDVGVGARMLGSNGAIYPVDSVVLPPDFSVGPTPSPASTATARVTVLLTGSISIVAFFAMWATSQ